MTLSSNLKSLFKRFASADEAEQAALNTTQQTTELETTDSKSIAMTNQGLTVGKALQEVAAKYRFQQHQLYHGGTNQLQVVEDTEQGVVLHSQFELIGSTGDVVITEWLAIDGAEFDGASSFDCSAYFVAVDNVGQFFIGQLSKPGKYNLSACFSLAVYPTEDICFYQGQIWLVAAKQSGRFSHKQLFVVDFTQAVGAVSNLMQIRLGDHFNKWVSEYDVPFAFARNTMVCTAHNELVFYQRSKHGSHQLVCFNPVTAHVQEIPLTGKPAPDDISVRNTFFQDKARGLVLLANAETVGLSNESSKVDTDLQDDNHHQQRFDYSLQLIDLNQKQVSWSRIVRSLHVSQICSDYEAEDIVEALTSIAQGELDSEHHEGLQTFIECLTSAVFAKDGNSIWLAWQDGVVQQLSLQGDNISPLYQLVQLNQAGEQRGLSFDHDLLTIQGQINQCLFVAVGEEEDASLWQCTVPSVNPDEFTFDGATNTPLVCERADINLIIDSAEHFQPSATGQVDIVCRDLSCNTARLAALQQLETLMPQLRLYYQAQSQSDALYFAFIEQQVAGCISQSEYNFFAAAAYDDKCASVLANIVKQFASWGVGGHLKGLKGIPVLAEAVLSLAFKLEYLDVLAEYFNALDNQLPIHPFHVHRTMAVIRDTHAGTPELARFLQRLPWPWNDAEFTVPNVGDYDE
ncbi:hypothetical protein [Shewanella fidelis]|uniref:Uncharacterized protein n=1 Tax=Shewanella fidelis TaxID=173509 RepID=A0AAW8NKQ1_9GAMM|nr:hypothetical protein [Shewanella fidelis]MDR8523116.1 hypothetical protein [Shewanella fidelis]MDW4811558.1 hypothetical protein [Shewanella fidelis]MDW4815679.1 hypothetical protein [Shewanella fidelis]MDW4819769.1 hypothetical protein [Shewanella fidelis]MDW4824257.1 hypothetical protein [Shewanella fidelis]